MIRISDITALIADDAMAASYLSMGAYRSGLISIIQSEAPTPGVINTATAASEIKWPMACRERVWMAGLSEHGMIDLGHLWNRDTGEVAAIFIGPPDTPEAITLAFPCQSWAARVFNALVEEKEPADQAEPPAAQPVPAPKHEGLRVDASGVLGRVEGPEKHFANQMLAHLEELATRYYGGDVAVVDEFLQLYCLDDKRPETLTLPTPCSVREEEPAQYVVGTHWLPELQLLPCPFCGQTDFVVERLDYSSSVVICQGMIDAHSACLARGPVGGQDDDGEEQPGYAAAVREWNKRPSAATPEQQVEQEPVAWIRADTISALALARAENFPSGGMTLAVRHADNTIPLYTTPPAAPDVSGLVEALERIYDEGPQVPRGEDLSEGRKQCIFRIRKIAQTALSAHREQKS